METPILQSNIVDYKPNCPSENRHPVGASLLAKVFDKFASKLAPATGFRRNGLTRFKPQAPIAHTHCIAVITQIKNHIPQSVALHGNNYPITGYLSTQPAIGPGMRIGDRVYVSVEEAGVLIIGVVMLPDKQVQANFTYVEGKLVIEAQGAVILKSGKATVELTEAGEIRIDGKNVRTVAEDVRTIAEDVRTIAEDVSTVAHESLTMLSGKVDVN